MKLNRILCPIDFSKFSKAANFYASLFAQATDAQVTFLTVLHPVSIESPVETQLDDLFMKLTFDVRPYVPDIRHKFVVEAGDPSQQILKYAKENEVDLIVMGTHGTTGMMSLLQGSVCKRVLRKSTCPVMAVKDTVNVDWISPVKEASA